ncbi:MAG: hypothetical protein COW01_09370 [Bdellovibrionales bacterium CG12_big_fil_rev_8_21_14_0_65_38_15]|nr:MAG: hypothetical protein COW79_09375 [Bdellovibrionales bacterium CG22_combo_CG10-13_8_21_14_all_38_13]PIQ54737.1 MAG: hypothetical protein COW01_09370 [Bdellovibrionales bacterium CG12_big_fil_rev_8_21_14_0_65_38_15]PIR31292.1 MAG: hypothetical protein COV38_00985 [Bdellovibrionales bacterium CG11_big_fil_rev_8_21_14_0_20_38_13]
MEKQKPVFVPRRLVLVLKKIRRALERESIETKDMIMTYLKFSRGLATEEEMKDANLQFQDFLKTIGLGVFAVLPFAPLTIPFLVTFGKRIGIDVIPDSFREEFKRENDLDIDPAKYPKS